MKFYAVGTQVSSMEPEKRTTATGEKVMTSNVAAPRIVGEISTRQQRTMKALARCLSQAHEALERQADKAGVLQNELEQAKIERDRFGAELAHERRHLERMMRRVRIFHPLYLALRKLLLSKRIERLALFLIKGVPIRAPRSGENDRYFHIDTPKRRRVAYLKKNSLMVAGWAFDLKGAKAIKVRAHLGNKTYLAHSSRREDVRHYFLAKSTVPAVCGFRIGLDVPSGVRRLIVEIKSAAGRWESIYESILLRGPLQRHDTPEGLTYEQWTKFENSLDAKEIPKLKRHIDAMLSRPVFSVVIDARKPGKIHDTLRSIRNQIYPNWDLHILGPVGAVPLRQRRGQAIKHCSKTSLSEFRGDFITFVKSGDQFSPRALYEFSAAINDRPEADAFYADEDRITSTGKQLQPFFKPDWSPDYLETFNYIGYPACFRSSMANGCFASGHYYDFVLRFTERTDRVHHLRKVLCHRFIRPATDEGVDRVDVQRDKTALAGRLHRTGRSGTVKQGSKASAFYDIAIDLKDLPRVSVVVPTAGKVVTIEDRNVDLIVNCVSRIRKRSTYQNIEIIIVDNGDLSSKKVAALKSFGCRFVTYTEPVFNVAKKLNLGASMARGKMLVLLNDDIEIITPAWIERMLEHFEKKHVGVVGAKLLYPDELTQHVGVVHNNGNPDHVRRGYPRDDEGYFFSTCGSRNYMAVTGACMMTPVNIYRRVGGYSDELAVNFNDVDYCMKVRALGLHVVYAPKAELFHFESQSRGQHFDWEEHAWYSKRWAREIVSDSFYNEQFLTIEPPTFEPSINRRLS